MHKVNGHHGSHADTNYRWATIVCMTPSLAHITILRQHRYHFYYTSMYDLREVRLGCTGTSITS